MHHNTSGVCSRWSQVLSRMELYCLRRDYFLSQKTVQNDLIRVQAPPRLLSDFGTFFVPKIVKKSRDVRGARLTFHHRVIIGSGIFRQQLITFVLARSPNATKCCESCDSSREMACAECHRMKVRCDRAVPCSTCVKRGCAVLCPNGPYSIPPNSLNLFSASRFTSSGRW